MTAKLVAEEGELKGLVLSLEGNDSWLIGRDPEACQLVIEDPLTSRKHLLARRTPMGISVENLSHTNPAQLNDELIEEPRLLQNGDTLKIGSEIFRFYSDTNAQIINESMNTSPQNTNTETPNSPLADSSYDNDTIFDANPNGISLADINFGTAETGRWLLKVIGGPNNGAEFYMQTGHSYVLGTDPHSCDIVFHDTSVSRQHAKISLTEDDAIFIEDLKSRNGVIVNNEMLETKQPLLPSTIVTIGTTSFVVYDREGEMQTIISPLLPSIVKKLQHDEESKRAAENTVTNEKSHPQKEATPVTQITPVKTERHWGPIIVLAIIGGVFSLGGIATYSLFSTNPVAEQAQVDSSQLIAKVMKSFPAVRYSYNKSTGGLLLLGHVATTSDKYQMMYALQNIPQIKSIDDSGLIIDEGVWRELNSVISNNPAWQGINLHSPAAGEFVISGYLKTHKQAEQLSDYMSVNFPYLDLLKNQVVVEEDVLGQINSWIKQLNISTITPSFSNGEINLNGIIPQAQTEQLNMLIQKIRSIPGVRLVNNYIQSQAGEAYINISDQYEVTGQSKIGNKLTVVVNGRFLSEGDVIDGMTVKKITPHSIILLKDETKYRIDYTK